MSTSRRPSVSIYDYPEHLNPFNEENPAVSLRAKVSHQEVVSSKDSKHKFWTFGRSRKKRSHSFSIKSTWNGLFGKRKDAENNERKSTITTVSTTYKRDFTERSSLPATRLSKDQQEFDEALGTLTRRRKYTLDIPSRYGSSLTVNGDATRIYEGSPQDTTTSILDNVTPKPPARRFGQVSPRPTDKIPPLNFQDSSPPKENGLAEIVDRNLEETPVPPRRRSGLTSSQRYDNSPFGVEKETNRSAEVSLRDENENVADDYVFKRFGQDAVRRSNLSINSCISVASTASAYGRKKRRAPQPPRPKELEEDQEMGDSAEKTRKSDKTELEVGGTIDIASVRKNIDAMTKKNEELDRSLKVEAEKKVLEHRGDTTMDVKDDEEGAEEIEEEEEEKRKMEKVVDKLAEISYEEIAENTDENDDRMVVEKEGSSRQVDTVKDDEVVKVEYRRASTEGMEILKDVEDPSSLSSLSLTRSDSFSVKDEIEKIEKQIKALESRKDCDESTEGTEMELRGDVISTKAVIQANRRNFFQHLVEEGQEGQEGQEGPEGEEEKDRVKISFKELPREQKSFDVVKLTDPPHSLQASPEPVKVIELHISEPIKQRPEILDDINPIPKPRRHSALSLNNVRNAQNMENRGQSF